MKNLAAYLDDFIDQEDGYFESCKNSISCKKSIKKMHKEDHNDCDWKLKKTKK